ncbi:MAG: hypothetical protein OXE04_01740 [bacterium]|nr:hypothetical protein [bacterium]
MLKVLLIGALFAVAGCSSDTNTSLIRTSPIHTSTATGTHTNTATVPESSVVVMPELPIPELLVWPRSEPDVWPQTPDQAAVAFAAQIASGIAAAQPRPAIQVGSTATAELPRIAEGGTPFGLASTIHLQQVQLQDGSETWVVTHALSPDIVIRTPAAGHLLDANTVVIGEGRGFEGTIILEIEDQDGLLGSAIADGGSLGENEPFETPLPFTRNASGDWANLVGFTTSAADGSISALTMLPMRLEDGS